MVPVHGVARSGGRAWLPVRPTRLDFEFLGVILGTHHIVAPIPPLKRSTRR